jgi:hypothetical protein
VLPVAQPGGAHAGDGFAERVLVAASAARLAEDEGEVAAGANGGRAGAVERTESLAVVSVGGGEVGAAQLPGGLVATLGGAAAERCAVAAVGGEAEDQIGAGVRGGPQGDRGSGRRGEGAAVLGEQLG